jgi:hypothetical protein
MHIFDFNTTVLLLQVNDELLQVLLNQKRHAASTLPSLCIKGDPFLRSEAVLCSGDKTYGLKRVETSNSRTNDYQSWLYMLMSYGGDWLLKQHSAHNC